MMVATEGYRTLPGYATSYPVITILLLSLSLIIALTIGRSVGREGGARETRPFL